MAHQILTADLLPEVVAQFDQDLAADVSVKKPDPVVAQNQQFARELRGLGVHVATGVRRR